MSIAIWEGEYEGKISDGDMSYPIIIKAEPGGDVIERRLFLRHDNLTGTNPESSYGVSVDPVDLSGTDESIWIQIASDVSGVPGTYSPPGDSLYMGDILGGEIKAFWIKVTMPADTHYGVRTDVKLGIKSTAGLPGPVPLDLSKGTFTNCSYNKALQQIEFAAKTNDTGEWISEWIDSSAYSSIKDFNVNYEGFKTNVSFRTSTDGTTNTATSWVDLEDLTFTGYIQVRLYFYNEIKVTGSFLREDEKATILDSFNRPNSTVIGIADSGQEWQSVQHTFSIENNMLRKVTSANDGQLVIPVGNTYVDCELQFLNSVWGATSDHGIMFRWTGVNQFYMCWLVSDGRYILYKRNGTGHDVLLSLTPGWATGDLAGVRVQGNVITLTKNGTALASYTDTANTYPTGTHVGFRWDSNLTRRVDNFKAWILDKTIVKRVDLELVNPSNSINFDIQLFDGPDVPEHIAPELSYDSKLFAPDLTVFVRNCDQIEWQMDTVTTFDSGNLSQWTSVAVSEQNNTSKSPTTDRPPGIWYWRARGVKNNMYSAWSDYWFLEILPLQSQPEYIYLHRNVGVEMNDPMLQDRHVYVHANTGIEQKDPTLSDRHIYVHANVDVGIGKVIYPIDDQTGIRKKIFDGDEEFVNGS